MDLGHSVLTEGHIKQYEPASPSLSISNEPALMKKDVCGGPGDRREAQFPGPESFFRFNENESLQCSGNTNPVHGVEMSREEFIKQVSPEEFIPASSSNILPSEQNPATRKRSCNLTDGAVEDTERNVCDSNTSKVSEVASLNLENATCSSSTLAQTPTTDHVTCSKEPRIVEGPASTRVKENEASCRENDANRDDNTSDLRKATDELEMNTAHVETEVKSLRVVLDKIVQNKSSKAEMENSDCNQEIQCPAMTSGNTEADITSVRVSDDDMDVGDEDQHGGDVSSDEDSMGSAGERVRFQTPPFPLLSLPVETVIKLEPREWVDDTPDDADRDPDWSPEHGLWHPGCHADVKQELQPPCRDQQDAAALPSTSNRGRGRKRKKKKCSAVTPRKSRTTEFECDRCDKKYKIITNLQKHQRLSHPPPAAPSNEDEPLSRTRQTPSRHPQRRVAAKAVYSCQHCDEKFLDKVLRDEHARVHQAEAADVKSDAASPARAASSSEAPTLPRPTSNDEQGADTSEPGDPPPRKKRYRGNRIFVCHYCGKKFGRKDHRDKHHRTHPGEEAIYSDPSPEPRPKKERSFSCDKCGKTFARKDHCNKHMLTHTGEKLFSCEICGKMLSRKDHLVRHVRNHESNGERRARLVRPHTPVECEICGRSFQFAAHLTKHSETPHTKEEPWDCWDCRKIFPTKTALRNHRLIHNDENALDCEDCGKVFLEPDKLEKHRLSAHRDQTVSFECDVCSKVFPRKDKLKRHMLTRHTAQIFQCEQCGESFPRQVSLEAHMVEHMGDSAFQCKYCLKKFAIEEKMLRHQEKHTALKSFQCETCGKAFLRKESLRLHRLVHTGGAFKCQAEGCDKSFPREKDLDRHFLHVHTDIRPYECEKCGKRFATTRHKQEHQKLIRCDAVKCFCGAVFSRLGYMKLHQRQEHGMGDPLFPCEICGKQFLNKGSLGNHYPVHSGKKEWQCEECPKSFTWKGALTRHMRLHVRDAEMAAAKDVEAAAMVAANFARAKASRKSSSSGVVRATLSTNSEEMNTTLESIGESLVKRAAENTAQDPKTSASCSEGGDASAVSVSPEAQSAVTSAIQNAVNAAIQGAGEAATQRAMTAAIQGAVVAAIQGAGPEATQGAVTSAIQGAVTAAIQGAVAAAIQGAVTSATAESAASQLAEESEQETRAESAGQSAAWNLATGSGHSPTTPGIDAPPQEPGLVATHPGWSHAIQSIGYQAIQSAGYVPPHVEPRSAPPLLPLAPAEGRGGGHDTRDPAHDGREMPHGGFGGVPPAVTPWWHAGGAWPGH